MSELTERRAKSLKKRMPDKVFVFSPKKLIEARLDAELSVDQLAVLSDLERLTIWKIEKGRSEPKADTLGKIAAALGLTNITDLFELKSVQQPQPVEQVQTD